MSDGGKLYLGNKIDLLACLIDRTEYQSDAVVMITIITDGAVIVQMLKLAILNDEYTSQIFIPYINYPV